MRILADYYTLADIVDSSEEYLNRAYQLLFKEAYYPQKSYCISGQLSDVESKASEAEKIMKYKSIRLTFNLPEKGHFFILDYMFNSIRLYSFTKKGVPNQLSALDKVIAIDKSSFKLRLANY